LVLLQRGILRKTALVLLQRGACDTLQHTATHCNTLQHTATHRTNVVFIYKCKALRCNSTKAGACDRAQDEILKNEFAIRLTVYNSYRSDF